MMKGNNQIFHNNFPEDKMTESVKLANYRGSAHEGNLQHFQKYAAGGNQDNNDQMQQRQDKSTPRDGIDIVGHTRQIKTEYSQVSHIESGFQKSKTNQAQMLKELRSEYDNLKNLPLDRQQQRTPSSNSDSRQEGGTSEVASSIPTSKHRKRNRQVERDRDYGQRQQRIWIVEKKQYQSIVANCQQKIEQLLHAEMGYKKTIHQLRSSIISPKSNNDNKAEQMMIKELQNSLRQEKEKNKYLQIDIEKSKNFSRQQTEKLSRIEAQFSSRTREIHQYEDDKRKLEDLIRLERQKFQNSEIQKRKYQMEYQILKKDKQLQNNRLIRLNDHEKVVAEMNLKNELKKFEEQIQLKDRRYKLLLEEYEKLKKDSHEKKEKKQTQGTFQMFDQIKKLIQQNRNAQNQQFSKTMNLLINKMEEQKSQVQSSNNFDLENERLKAEIRLLKNQVQHLSNRHNQEEEIQNLKRFYENEILTLKDVINLLEKKLKQKQKIQVPIVPSSPKTFDQDSSSLKNRIEQLEAALAMAQSIAFDSEKDQRINKEKLAQDENQLRFLRRKLADVTFQLQKCQKQYNFQINLIKNEYQSNTRILRGDLERANMNVAYWQKEFENMKRFYQQKIEQKNRLIEQSSNTASIQEITKSYQRNFEIIKKQYQRQIANLTQKISDHPSYSVEYDELKKKYSHLEMIYFDLKNNIRRSWQLNQGINHLWGIKQTQYGNVHQILRQIKYRSAINYISTDQLKNQVRQNDIEYEGQYRNRQISQTIQEPQFILKQSTSGSTANRISTYQPALGAGRQTVYSDLRESGPIPINGGIRESGPIIRNSGHSIRQSGYGPRQSGYVIRESGSGVRNQGYGESRYGGIRMSSAYDNQRQILDYRDGYIPENEQQYEDQRYPEQYENAQGNFPRQSGKEIRRSSGYLLNQEPRYDERAPEGYRIRQSSGYGDDYIADYGARQSRPAEPIINSGTYDMSYEMRQSNPYNNRQSGAYDYRQSTPGFVEDPRISRSSYHGVRQSGYEPVMLNETRSGYGGGHSVYESYRYQPQIVYA